MDVKKVFRTVSRKLLDDFNISAQINHRGNKGSFREATLRDFLKSGRLPQRYGVGEGEIIGTARNVSCQSDLVIFDQLNGLALLLSDSIQVYPIESVHGVIEVKSVLSKQALVKALENIKSVKVLTPKWNNAQGGPTMTTNYARPAPFGMVFAYCLADNSLDSLCANLKEWEASNSPDHWPNLVAVLGEGIIEHYGDGLKCCVANKDIKASCWPIAIAYREDTLFQFYVALLDLCAETRLGVPELRRYYDPGEQMGPYLVRNHDRCRRMSPVANKSVYRFNLQFIEKVVAWCKLRGKLPQKALFLKQTGAVPLGFDDTLLDYEVYHYDPEELPGLHQVENAIIRTATGVHVNGRLLIPAHWIEVDNEVFYFPWAYVSECDIERIEGRTTEDL